MILIADRQESLRLPRAAIRRIAEAVLRGEGMGRAAVSLTFVDNREIRTLNRQFLDHDYATDVISFLLADAMDDLFGEVVVSAEYAKSEARQRAIPAAEELLRYVAHGLLHLLGYDDRPAAKKRVMWKKQEAYVKAATARRQSPPAPPAGAPSGRAGMRRAEPQR